MHRIYLDHNATTPVYPEVLAAMLPFLSGEFGNPSSIHSFGQGARRAVERAREAVAALIGARPSEIALTSGGTESDNAAIFGLTDTDRRVPCHIVTTVFEHHAVLHACAAMERRGVEVTYVPVDRDGVVDPEEIRRSLRPDTILLSVMHANNELGTLQPIAEIARIAAEAGVPFHTDAVQSAGKVPIDVCQLGVDLLSLSGHKFGAPQGVGALFIRKGRNLRPLLHGGGSERGRRAGTENVAGIVGLGKAAELALAHMTPNGVRIATLRNRLEQGLMERVPQARVNGSLAGRTPNTSNVMFPGADSESLVIALDLVGLACSAGAACSSGAVDASHVLRAIGLSSTEARASVRLSLGHTTTEEDIARALELIPLAASRQREVASAGSEVSTSR
jgi:cysteine desulfurase